MTTREKMEKCIEYINDIMTSGYWPFASPAPCSTECRIKEGIIEAKEGLQHALYWHDTMFTRQQRDDMTAPSLRIVEREF